MEENKIKLSDVVKPNLVKLLLTYSEACNLIHMINGYTHYKFNRDLCYLAWKISNNLDIETHKLQKCQLEIMTGDCALPENMISFQDDFGKEIAHDINPPLI